MGNRLYYTQSGTTETATRMVPGTCRAKKHKCLDFLDTLLRRDGEIVEK